LVRHPAIQPLANCALEALEEHLWNSVRCTAATYLVWTAAQSLQSQKVVHLVEVEGRSEMLE
jgi:hypothetical protein